MGNSYVLFVNAFQNGVAALAEPEDSHYIMWDKHLLSYFITS